MVLVVKNQSANAGDAGGGSLTPGPGRSSGGGFSNALQHSCLENPEARGVWQATVNRVVQSHARLKQLRMHTH